MTSATIVVAPRSQRLLDGLWDSCDAPASEVRLRAAAEVEPDPDVRGEFDKAKDAALRWGTPQQIAWADEAIAEARGTRGQLSRRVRGRGRVFDALA